MYTDEYIIVDNEKKSKLLALFSSLEERDKDIVITMTESLVGRYRCNRINISSNFTLEKQIADSDFMTV